MRPCSPDTPECPIWAAVGRRELDLAAARKGGDVRLGLGAGWPRNISRIGLHGRHDRRPVRSGGHASTGRGGRTVVEAADVGDPIAPQGQDLPALYRCARLASRRRAGDFQPYQKCPRPGRYLGDHRTCAGGSRAGPPRDDLVAVLAVGFAGPSAAPQRAPGSSRSLMASRSLDSRASLTRSVSSAASPVALALSGMKISLARHSWQFHRRCAGHPEGKPPLQVPTISWAVEVLGGDTVIEAPPAIGARPMARADAWSHFLAPAQPRKMCTSAVTGNVSPFPRD